MQQVKESDLRREVDEAVRVLREGGIILYPTDTVWGLGCDATNAEAVDRIYRLKRSENKKSMLVLCASADMVVRYVNRAPGIAFEVMEMATSPLTLILPGATGVAANLIPDEGTLGIRVPDHEFCRRMLRALQRPVVSTSANISGEATPAGLQEVSREIIDGVDFVVNPRFEGKPTRKASSIIAFGEGKVTLAGAEAMLGSLETPIQKRFSDIDPFQHVNNVSQQMYFDVGKMAYYDQVLGAEVLLGDLRIVTVSTSTSYMGQVRMHDPVRITTTCERVGNKSLTLFQQLLVGDEVRSESRSVMVVLDFPRQVSAPVPDEWRARLLAD